MTVQIFYLCIGLSFFALILIAVCVYRVQNYQLMRRGMLIVGHLTDLQSESGRSKSIVTLKYDFFSPKTQKIVTGSIQIDQPKLKNNYLIKRRAITILYLGDAVYRVL